MKQRCKAFLITAFAASAACLPVAAPALARTPVVCVDPGRWIDGGGGALDAATALRQGANAPVVVLGESHENAEDHRWQTQTLAGIYALNPKLAIGMEMFPRRLQPILDRWSAGELDEATFLKLAEWDKVWGYSASFYLPIMHFARMNRLPLVALNVERSLVSRTGREGWAAIPADDREGVGDPAPVTAAYRERLAAVAGGHGEKSPQGENVDRFIQAQSVWDRAMAEAAAAAHRRDGRTVVAIMGRGHAEYRDGVIRQLADLGLPDALAWLPWELGRDCNAPDRRIADAMFGVAAQSAAPRPRLGVEMRAAEGGLSVAAVAPGSVAAQAGLRAGDIILAAGGAAVRLPSDLIAMVRAIPPGAWLPLEVRRGRATRAVVAKFPPLESAQ